MPVLERMFGTIRTEPTMTGVCPLCGWKAEDLSRTGLLGCGLCYSSLSLNVPEQGAVQ